MDIKVLNEVVKNGSKIETRFLKEVMHLVRQEDFEEVRERFGDFDEIYEINHKE